MTKQERQQPNHAARKAHRESTTKVSAIRLQERDLNLLLDLHTYGCMLRDQILELYFGSIPRTNARMLQLFSAQYASRVAVPLPTRISSVSCQAAYMLGPAGIPLVAEAMGVDPLEIRRLQRHGSPGYLMHTLEIVEIRLAVEKALRTNTTVRLDRFLPERLCQHRYEYRERAGGGKEGSFRPEVYKPDAVMLLTWPTASAGFGLEVDLGHVSSDKALLKAKICARYAQGGLFMKRYGVELARTLFITTSTKRRDNLKSLMEGESHRHLWFTTFAEIATHGMLGPIWHAPFQSSAQRLLTAHSGE